MSVAEESIRSTRKPRNLRRTVAVGDLHGHLDGLKTILNEAKLIDGDSWRGGRSILVQLGDVVDRGPQSVPTYDYLADLQVRASKGKGEVVRLLGNHEVMLLEGDFQFADFPNPEKMANRIREDVLAGRVLAAHAYGGWLFTHAGAGFSLLQRLRNEMRGSEERPKRFTLKRLAAHLNQKLHVAVRNADYSDPIFAIGEARGGESATGGIFWADYDEELHAPSRAPRFHQVFGHTPEGYKGAKFRRATDGRRINIDIGINDDLGGNMGYLEIRNREAIAHYINKDGVVVESLGVAERLPKPVASPDPDRSAA